MACASCKSFFNLETAEARESALWSGPSWAAAILRCLAMGLSDEFSEHAGGTIHRAGRGLCGERPGHAAREVLARSALDFQLIVFNDKATTAEHRLRPALVDVALVRRVADGVVHHRVVD